MFIELILKMIYCFVASLFFALVMNSPKKTLLYSSIIASVGYLIYLIFVKFNSPKSGFFFGTLIIAFLGEMCARLLKMPATIFIFPAIVPIVPGLGLYQTILALVQNDIPSALEIGVTTFLNIGSMAISMAIVSLIALKMRNKYKN
jgi:uncharacterized membrane protein YjjB (DUF3815 family)